MQAVGATLPPDHRGHLRSSSYNLDRRLDVAFSDVAEAFAHYLGQYNQGRKVVIFGHSQGAYMAVELLKRFFDRDPVLRPRLLAGLVIGGRVEVRPGELTGGTFKNLPLCTGPDEVGCIVAYRAYREGAQVKGDDHGPPAGRETGCVHPAGEPPETRSALSRSYFPAASLGRGTLNAVSDIKTPSFLCAVCILPVAPPGDSGYYHLEIGENRSPATSARRSSIRWPCGSRRRRWACTPSRCCSPRATSSTSWRARPWPLRAAGRSRHDHRALSGAPDRLGLARTMGSPSRTHRRRPA